MSKSSVVSKRSVYVTIQVILGSESVPQKHKMIRGCESKMIKNFPISLKFRDI